MKRQYILPLSLNCLLVMAVLAGCFGCMEEAKQEFSEQNLSSPSPEQVVNALTWSEMAGIRTEASKVDSYSATLSSGLDSPGVPVVQLIEEIDLLPGGVIRNRRIENAIRLLLYENRFDDATKLVLKIDDVKTRDRLLEDVVRFQVQEAFKLYRGMARLWPENALPEQIQLPIRQAAAAAEKIEDPLVFMECIGNIALFRGNMKDEVGVEGMMRKTADSLLHRQETGFRKAKALVLAADWFLHQDDKKTMAVLVSAAEKALNETSADVNAALLYTEIVALYFLLDDAESIRRTCDRTEQVVARIVDLTQKAMALLRFADTLFLVQGKEKDVPLSEKLAKIKSCVMQANGLMAVPVAGENSFTTTQIDRNKEQSSTWTREEITEQKNTILRKVAVLQAWTAPLEDVWDTIEEIDPGPERDTALTTTIEKMIATRSTEYAKDWAEEISDPEKKQTMLKKLGP